MQLKACLGPSSLPTSSTKALSYGVLPSSESPSPFWSTRKAGRQRGFKSSIISLPIGIRTKTLTTEERSSPSLNPLRRKPPRITLPLCISHIPLLEVHYLRDSSSKSELSFSLKIKNLFKGLPWWLSGKGSARQRRRRGFDPWSGKAPPAAKHLSACAITTAPAL